MKYQGLAVAFVLFASLNINVKPASACGDSKATISHEKVAIITATHMPVRCSWSWDDSGTQIVEKTIVKSFEEGQESFQAVLKLHHGKEYLTFYDTNSDKINDALVYFDGTKYVLIRVMSKTQKLDPRPIFNQKK